MAKKPEKPEQRAAQSPLAHRPHQGDAETAIQRAIEEFKIDPAIRGRLAADPSR